MDYLTLAEIKKHLNIDTEFTDDDTYLEALGDAAEDVVSRYIDQPLSLLEKDGNIPQALKFAGLLWIGTMYSCRESVSSSNMQVVPHAFEMLCQLYKNYSYEKSNYANNRES